MTSDMSRSIKKSEAVARSEFYPNSTKEVLNNVIDRVSCSVLGVTGRHRCSKMQDL